MRPLKWNVCLHCKRPSLDYGRRLCQVCYRNVAIRDLYPRRGCAPQSYAEVRVRSLGHGTPTDALPGSPEKIEVLTDRFAKGQELFNPEDAKEVLA